MKKFDYSKEEFLSALTQIGIRRGSSVFIHSNIALFGRLEGASSGTDHCRILLETLLIHIGKEGTLIVPTFSYSFCWKQVFNPQVTPSTCGVFSEYVRTSPGVRRSSDPNFSIAAIGLLAEHFTKNSPPLTFGPGSFWEKFKREKGVFLNFNFEHGAGSTFIHYVERELGVTYRYDKSFKGTIEVDGVREEREAFHFVAAQECPDDELNAQRFTERALSLGLARKKYLGRGMMVAIGACETFELIESSLKSEPRFMTAAS